MAKALGCGEAEAKAALLKFGGVERRLQKIGEGVYDDYAHNPEKIRAMWTTLAEAHPEGVCVVWRPHGYAPLRKLLDALAETFNETVRPCDKLLLPPVYDAGGTADRSINSDALAEKIDPGKVAVVRDLDEAYGWICANRSRFAAFATCGARDPELPILARRIAGG
jgi:UDP-N-acetylmuramate-alanine ligase